MLPSAMRPIMGANASQTIARHISEALEAEGRRIGCARKAAGKLHEIGQRPTVR